MRPKSILLLLASITLAWCYSGNPVAAQEPDLAAITKKATDDLTAADKVVVAARNALNAAQRALDTTVFNSASYNVRITTAQEQAAKDKYEKAEPNAKEEALELYELAQELSAQRKEALDAAEKLLPQREAEAKAAEETYGTALTAAEAVAAQIKAQLRQTEAEAATKLKDSKLAIEHAAFTKAAAEQQAAANAAIVKTMTDLVAADTALQQAAAAVKQATDANRAEKVTAADAATKAYAVALQIAVQNLSSSGLDQANSTILGLCVPLVEADKVLQKATAALQQAQQDVQNKTNAVTQTEARIKALQEGVEKRIAKTRAQKDLAREQEAAKRTAAAKLEAEQALPAKTADVEKAQQAYTALLQAAVKTLVQSVEAEKSVAADNAVATAKAAADKANADKVVADKALADKANAAQAAATALVSADAVVVATKTAAEKADAEKVAAEKAVAEKTAAALAATTAAAAETDAAKKAAADELAAKATAEKAAAEQSLAEKVAAVPVAAAALTAAQTAQASVKAAAEKAAAEKAAAEKQVADTVALVQKTTADLATANEAAAVAKAAAQRPAAEKALLAKAMADKEAELKKENEALAAAAAAAQVAADKASAELVAADKLVAARVASREGLNKILRQRFYRDAGAAQDELRRNETALATANRELQPKVAAFNKATTDHKAASDVLTKAQQAVAAQATVVATATTAKDAADKAVQEKVAAKAAAEQAAKDAQVAVTAAQEALAAAAAEDKAALEAQVKEKEAAAQVAAQKVKEAEEAAKPVQAALDKAVAALTATQTKAAEVAKVATDAEQKVAAAKTALDKATAEKTAGEQLVSERRAAFEAAPIKVAVARAAAYGGLKPLDASAWDYAKARHLMIRAGFGGTPDEVAALQAKGLHGAVSHFVNFKNLPPADVAFAAHPRSQPENYESALSGDEQRLLRNQRVAEDRNQIENMRRWWLQRMIESPRPLEEKLTLFWHGQVPVQYTTVGDSYYMYLQNQLYREHAAGNFSALLYGISHDAAMLKYLNNDTNVKGKANENLAREIIELFSMGRDQGYTEIDIRQGARALTGYTYDPATGQFRFISDRHDTEPKTIFGKTGNWSGDDYVRLILETPYPAKFIARQMFTFFTHSEPSIDTIESLASVLRLNNYELTPMLENLFLSEEFYSAQSMSTEVKSPVQLVVGLHRDLGLKSPDYAYLATACRDMGQDLFEPPSVFGWQPGRSWVTTSRVLSRYNVLAEIIEKRPRAGKAGVDVVGTLLAGKEFQNHGEVVDYLVKCCWNVPLPEGKKAALLEFLKPLPEPAKWAADAGAANARLTRLLAMLMCSPEYQLG